MKKVFVFWLEYPLMHMAGLIKEVSSKYRVLVFFEQEIPANRKSMGFVDPDFGDCTVQITPCIDGLDGTTLSSKVLCPGCENFIHIFHGFDSCKKNYRWLKFLTKHGSKCFVQMESSRTYGIRGAMSLLKAKYRALKWRSKVEGVLAFGSQGVEYYVKAGFYSSIVQEWRYFGPSVREFGDEQLTNAGDSEYDVAFVGKLDIRKNVSILLEAVSILKMRAEKKLRVIIVGDGPELEKLKSLADDLDVAEQIRFLSSVDNNHVFKVLKGSKMLVLPSLHDGWGYVVNEGLSAGCNVIVSKKCGSSSIFERKKLSGYSIFDPLSPEDLASGIVEALNAWSNLSRSENIRFFNEELSSQKGLEMLEGLAS